MASVSVRKGGFYFFISLGLKGYVIDKPPYVSVSSDATEYTYENITLPGSFPGNLPSHILQFNYLHADVTLKIGDIQTGFNTINVGTENLPSTPTGVPPVRPELFDATFYAVINYPSGWVLMGVDHEFIPGTNVCWATKRYQYRYKYSG